MNPFAKKPKYKNTKVEVDGIVFDSKAEAARWRVLSARLVGGEIRDLRRQPAFELVPSVKINGKTVRAMVYRADFEYIETATGRRVIEDVKGMILPAYKMKRHLMKALLNLEINEVK